MNVSMASFPRFALTVLLAGYGFAQNQDTAKADAETKPLPLPISRGDISSRPDAGQPVYHNMPAPTGPMMIPTSTENPGGGADPTVVPGAAEPVPDVVDFGTRAAAATPRAFPQSMNVRLVLDFGTSTGFATGTLIDPYHVLTAGHCVHTGGSTGVWARSIQVIPGYDNGARPYGTARMTTAMSYVGWTRDRDFGYDLGVIRLDRPIGAITGYFGYGYSTNWSFYNTSTWWLHGYPGEAPFYGHIMTQQSGWFDTETNGDKELRFRYPSVGGQSGSGAYKFVNNARSVHAVLSHGEWNWFYGWDTDCTRITAARFVDVFNFVFFATPFTTDLTPCSLRSASTTLRRGSATPTVDFLLHNNSHLAFNGNVNIRLSLSSDSVVNAADAVVGTTSRAVSLGTKGSTRLTMPAITVPTTLTAGTYYLGVVITNADANPANNVIMSDETIRVTVL